MSNLISLESRLAPGGLRGPAAGLESLAAQARTFASTRDLDDFVRAQLVAAASKLETAAAALEADDVLADAEALA